jgi:translation elongation factor EF-G
MYNTGIPCRTKQMIMTLAELKNITKQVCESHVEQMAKSILDILMANRIKEIQSILSTDKNKEREGKLQMKIDVLQQPYNQKFYQQLLEETKNDLMQTLLSKTENASVNLINAEYFGFNGRLR